MVFYEPVAYNRDKVFVEMIIFDYLSINIFYEEEIQ